MKRFKFECGVEVRDLITGFTGIVAARVQYLTGCNRYQVQSRELKDSKPSDWVSFDEDQIEYVGEGVNLKIEDPGGPQPFESQLQRKD